MGKEDYSVTGQSANGSDPEKAGLPTYGDEAPAITGQSFVTGNSLYARTQRFAAKFGVEPRGIERVPEDERTDTNLVKVGTLVRSTPNWKHQSHMTFAGE